MGCWECNVCHYRETVPKKKSFRLVFQQASRGQSGNLILVDEVGFVNSKVLLAVKRLTRANVVRAYLCLDPRGVPFLCQSVLRTGVGMWKASGEL